MKIDFFGDAAWIHGASPTAGVLGFALKGPFTHFYQTITGYQMTPGRVRHRPRGSTGSTCCRCSLIGVALILGVGVRLAAIGGIVWMVIFYTATAIWPEHNPFLDEHIIDALVLAAAVPGERRPLLRTRQGLAAHRVRHAVPGTSLERQSTDEAGPRRPASSLAVLAYLIPSAGAGYACDGSSAMTAEPANAEGGWR